MKEIVENWLRRLAEEKGDKEFSLTHLLVKYLISDDYTFLRYKGGPGEEGMDIIAKKKNVLYKFQLKRGDINTEEWGKIYAQLDEMVTLAAPENIDQLVEKNYLVTNGVLGVIVKQKINKFNKNPTKWKNNKLGVWDRGVLVEKIGKKMTIPLLNEQNFNSFGRLYFDLQFDSKDLLNVHDYENFLSNVLPIKKYKQHQY